MLHLGDRDYGDALHTNEATVVSLAVVAGALRPRVFGEEHGMQDRDLNLCQNLFL